MLQEKEESSHSIKEFKKKKKFVYLDKFEEYKTDTTERLETIRSTQQYMLLIIIVIVCVLMYLNIK